MFKICVFALWNTHILAITLSIHLPAVICFVGIFDWHFFSITIIFNTLNF